MVHHRSDEILPARAGRFRLRRLGRWLLRASWLLLLFVIWACLLFVFQPFGRRGWPFAAVAVMLAAVVAVLIRSARRDAARRGSDLPAVPCLGCIAIGNDPAGRSPDRHSGADRLVRLAPGWTGAAAEGGLRRDPGRDLEHPGRRRWRCTLAPARVVRSGRTPSGPPSPGRCPISSASRRPWMSRLE